MRSTLSRRAPRLALELLESRLVPAVTFQVADFTSDGLKDLSINGVEEHTRIVLVEDVAANELLFSLDINGDNDFTDAGEFQNRTLVATDGFNRLEGAVRADLGKGNDVIDYSVQNGNLTGVERTFTVLFGGGRDRFSFSTNKNNQHNRLIAGTVLTFTIDSGGGVDTLNFESLNNSPTNANIDDSTLAINATLGKGNDVFNLNLQNRDDFVRTVLDNEAMAAINVDGGFGSDSVNVTFDDVGSVGVAAFSLIVNGGLDAGNDNVDCSLFGDIDNGSEVGIQAQLFGGNDHFECELFPGTFDVEQGSSLTVLADGGEGNDFLEFNNGSDPDIEIMDIDGLVDATLQGGNGNDRFRVRFETDARFDLGATGVLKLRVLGGAGSDLLGHRSIPALGAFMLSNTDTSTGAYDVVIDGGGGADEVDLILNTPGAVTFGPDNHILLSGGAGGADRLISNNLPSPDVLTQFFELFGSI